MPVRFSFFFSLGNHRDLHSFPTRRSSDLDVIAVDVSPAAAAVARDNTRALGLASRDRKSTRLNSSHLGISYAVFCLKKKTKESRAIRWPWVRKAVAEESQDLLNLNVLDVL